MLGDEVRLVGPTTRGESASTFDIELSTGPAIVKLTEDRPGVHSNQQRLVRIVESLRARGHPAPEYLAVGTADGIVFTV